MGVSCSGDGNGLQGGWDIHGRSVSEPCDLKQPRFVGETHIWQIFDFIICLIIWSLIWGLNLYKTYESSFCCIWRIAGKRSQVRQNHPSPGSVGVSHSWVRAAKAYFFCNYKYLNINFALREMMCSVFFRHAFHHFAPKQSFGVPFLPWNHGGNIPKNSWPCSPFLLQIFECPGEPCISQKKHRTKTCGFDETSTSMTDSGMGMLYNL